MKLEEDFELSRDPSDYEASTHLIQRMRDRKMLEADIVTETIEDGEVVNVDENKGGTDKAVKIQHDWLQTTFEVVVCPTEGVVKTAYEVDC